MKKIAVAIDGPAGAGKSSISKILAHRLGYLYIDTGAMYRAITWTVLREKISCDDIFKIRILLDSIDLQMVASSGELKVYINEQDITQLIRSQEVNANVSKIAALAVVRTFLVKKQREMASVGGVILDGRDIASVVLPDAQLKIYLTASVEVRAKRRWLEMQEKGEQVTLEEIKKSVSARDEMDKNREESPLVCVPEAIVIDSSDMTFDDTVTMLEKLVREKIQEA